LGLANPRKIRVAEKGYAPSRWHVSLCILRVSLSSYIHTSTIHLSSRQISHLHLNASAERSPWLGLDPTIKQNPSVALTHSVSAKDPVPKRRPRQGSPLGSWLHLHLWLSCKTPRMALWYGKEARHTWWSTWSAVRPASKSAMQGWNAVPDIPRPGGSGAQPGSKRKIGAIGDL
jgi:hypothetical protein